MTTSVGALGIVQDNTSASLSITTSVAVPAGATIVVFNRESTTTTLPLAGAVTDSAGNAYSLAGTRLDGPSTNTGPLGAWYCQNCLALPAGGTITYTKTGATTDNTVLTASFAIGCGPYDSAAFGSNNSTTNITVTSGTPTSGGSLFFGAQMVGFNEATGPTLDVNWQPLTSLFGTGNAIAGASQDRYLVGRTTVTHSIAFPSAGNTNGIIIGFGPPVVTLGRATAATAATLAITTPTAVPAGATIVVGVRENNTTTNQTGSSLTDSAGNTYSLAGVASNTSGRTAMFYCSNCLALASSGTITYTKTGLSTNSTQMEALFATDVGAYDSAAFGSNVSNSSGTTITITSGTPAVAGETFFGFTGNSGASSTFTQDAAWSAPPFDFLASQTPTACGAFRTNAPGAAITYAPTWGTAATSISGIVIGFKPTTAFSVVNIGHTTNAANASFTQSVANGVPAGATIIVAVRESTTTTNPTSGSVTDSAGNSYTLSGAVVNTAGRTGIWYCQNCLTIASAGTITYTKTGATTDPTVICAGYITGIGAYDSAVFASNVSNSNVTTLTVTSGTPSVAGELFVAFMGVQVSETTITNDLYWASSPFDAAVSTTPCPIGGFRLNAGNGTLTYAPSWGTTGTCAGAVIGFQPAGAAVVAANSNLPMMGVG